MSQIVPLHINHSENDSPESTAAVWAQLQREAVEAAAREPDMAPLFTNRITERRHLADALTSVLAAKLDLTDFMTAAQLRDIFSAIHFKHHDLAIMAADDLRAVVARDPAAQGRMITPLLFFKGFHALQTHRLAHVLWHEGRENLALYLQSSCSRRFTVDIHPAAKIGRGVLFDHATGIVIGETAVVEDNVSLLHGVTLGGTGKETGDRHPKIRRGVLIGAGAKILGNIEVGENACVAAESVVLHGVPPGVTVAGVPARIVGAAQSACPGEDMNQNLPI